MKLSLRKASALQLVINEAINEPFVGEAVVTKYDDPATVLAEAAETLTATITKKFDLIGVLYSVRDKVATAGAAAGVAQVLTDLAELNKRESFFKQLAKTTNFAPPLALVTAKLEEIKADKTPNTTYPYTKVDSVKVPLLTKETIETYSKALVDLRRQKTKLTDKLLHLNVTTEITLGDAESELLTKYDIV
jgi:hypothetical protein